MKKQELKKMRRGLGTSGATLNVPISESQGRQKKKGEEEEKEQEIGSSYEKTMKENFPNLVKETNI